MLLCFVYLVFVWLLVGARRSADAKDIELLVLRYQLDVCVVWPIGQTTQGE